jgi:hypothetical protein
VILACALLVAATTSPVAPTPGRVYVARLRANDVGETAAAAIEESILVAAKKARPDLTVLGRSDVATLADMQAEQSAAGCDAESCAAEIADALGAPQIVTGKLTRLGSTWILSLTRLERGSLLVLARESVEKQGETAAVLIPEVPHLVDVLFDAHADKAVEHGEHGGSGLAIAGGVGLGAGVVTAVGGGVLLGVSYALYADAQKAAAAGDTAKVKSDGEIGEPLNIAGWAVLATGAVVGVVGGVMLALGSGD